MTREERLNYCRVCNHRQKDFQKGIVCSLTGEQADFEGNCSNYIENPEYVSREKIKQKDRGVGTYAFKDSKNKAADWLTAIGVLSIINSIIAQFGVMFIFGLGATVLLDSIAYIERGFMWLSIPFTLFMSFFFIYSAYLFNKKKYEWVFPVAYLVYVLDLFVWIGFAVFSREISGYASVALHAVLLFVLYTILPLHSKKVLDSFKQFKKDAWSTIYVAWAVAVVVGMIVAIALVYA